MKVVPTLQKMRCLQYEGNPVNAFEGNSRCVVRIKHQNALCNNIRYLRTLK
jgi:hypothetical protein